MKILSLTAVFLFVRCSHVPLVKPTGLLQTSFWEEQTHRRLQMRSILAKAKISYLGKDESLTGIARVRSIESNGFRLEIRDPLGRMQLLSVLHGVSFTAYYPTRKLAYRDTLSGLRFLDQLFGAALSMSELQSLVLGLLPASIKSPFLHWDWDQQEGAYVGNTQLNDRSFTCVVDAYTAVLRRIEISPRLVFLYSDFRTCCDSNNSRLGHQVLFENQQAQTSITIDWEEIRQDSEQTANFKIDVPKGTRVR